MNRHVTRGATMVGLLLSLSCSDSPDQTLSPTSNRAPVVNGISVEPAALMVGQLGRIRVDASDPDQDVLTVVYVSQLGVVTPEGNGLTALYQPARSGRDFLTVRVLDARGAETRFETYVTVSPSDVPGSDEGPPPRLSFSPPPASNDTIVVAQGQPLRVDLCGEPAASYRISWGDGTVDTTCRAEHVYTSSGLFRLVVDGSGSAPAAAPAARTAKRGEVRAAADFHDERWVSVIPPGGPPQRPTSTTTTTSTTSTTTTVPGGSTTTSTTTPGSTTTTSTTTPTSTTTSTSTTTTSTLPPGSTTTTTTSTLAPTTTITTTTSTTTSSTTLPTISTTTTTSTTISFLLDAAAGSQP